MFQHGPPPPPLVIHAAIYGTQRRSADVRHHLLRIAPAGSKSIRFTVSNSVMGGDPAPGEPKHFTLTYSWGGGPAQTLQVAENGEVRLDAPGAAATPGIDVLQAHYGAGSTWADVTAAVKRHVPPGTRHARLRVGNAIFGDP